MHCKFHNFIPANFLFSVPAAYLSIGLLGGILTANCFQAFFAVKSNPIISVTIIFFLFLLNSKSKELSVLAAFFAGFFLQNSWQTTQNFGENKFLDGETVQIYAEFYSHPNFRSEKEISQRATISGSDYRISINLTDSLANFVLIPGERAKITGIFSKFDTKNTAAPWEYDEIFQDRIKNTIGSIEVISIEKSLMFPAAAKIYEYINKKFEKTKYYYLYLSLFTGDRSNIPQNIKSFFQESGLVHFLSISGLHIAVLIFAFSTLSFILPLPFLMRKIIISVLILCLPFIVGFGPATLRAVIMGTILTLSPLFNRKSNPLNSLFAACFLILAIYPMHFFLIGFQYSFAATFGILTMPKILGNIKFKNKVLIFALPIFMFLLTTPIQIYHFATITWSSPICNLFLLPILSIICQTALISLFIPFAPLSHFLLFLCDKTLDLIFFVINKFIIFTGLGEQYANIPSFCFVAIIIVFFTFSSFQKYKIIYSVYSILALTTAILLFDLFKKDMIYTISSQNFRMKLKSGKNSAAVILGGAQTKLYYNPQFIRWLKTNLSEKNSLIITDESYIPIDFFENYRHEILENATGEIKFDCEDDEHKTKEILSEEKKQRKSGTAKEYYRYPVKK